MQNHSFRRSYNFRFGTGVLAFAFVAACSDSAKPAPAQPTSTAGAAAQPTPSSTAGMTGATAGKSGSAGMTSIAGRGVTPPTAGKAAVDDDDAGVAGNSGSTAGASGGGGSAGAAGSGTTMSQGPIDYTKRGPYTVTRLLNQAMGTISGGSRASIPANHTNDPSAFTLFFPENAQAGERFPLLTFGNGTYCSPTFYDELIGHVVSFGYIVIAPNTSNTGSAEEMLKGVDWALAQDMQSGSPIFEKVDREQIGAFGHSQGGAGTCKAGADARVKTVVPLSGTTAPADIKGTAFFVTTGGEAMSSSGIETAFNNAKGPAVYGVTMSGNHDEYTDVEDDPMVSGLTSDDAKQSRAAVAAWFDWQLKNKSENKALFVGDSCGFCKDSTWGTIKSKGF